MPIAERVREVNIRAVCVPLTTPHRTSSAVITESPLVLTDLVTESGLTGHSIVFTYTRTALKPTGELISNIGKLLVGEALAPVAMYDKLASRFRLLGVEGLVGMALSGIDMAAWDALARSHETSLVQLLGGVNRPLMAYAGLGFDGPDECARQAETYLKQGFRAVKAKVGYASVGEDLNLVRSLRKVIGDDAAIMIDYNQSLSPADAIERLRRLDDEGLTWIEEPTSAHDHAGHASVSRAIKTPIQCGENWWGPEEVRSAITAQASDYIMLDPMKIGGITGWLRAAAMAQANNIVISNHLWPELSARLLSLSPGARWLEYIDWWNPILATPLELSGGLTEVIESVGSGIQWNLNQLEPLRV